VVTDHKFTGQKLDGTGLMYFNARYYDPVIGAFISPDTIVPDATRLFSYNRYMYVSGNPLNRIDPTGHIDVSPYLDPGTNCWSWCGVATMNPRPHPMAGPPDLPTREQVQTALDVVGTVDPTGIRVEDGFAKICCTITKNTQK
jgi:RHS repeat-associated protein